MKNKKQETILWILIYMIICVCVAWVYVPEILANKNGFGWLGRVNYMEEYGKKPKSSPPFQSAYICSQISEQQIIFEEQRKEAVIPPTAKAVGILTDFL